MAIPLMPSVQRFAKRCQAAGISDEYEAELLLAANIAESLDQTPPGVPMPAQLVRELRTIKQQLRDALDKASAGEGSDW